MATASTSVLPTRKEFPKLRIPFYAPLSALIGRLNTAFREQGDVLQLTGIPLNVFCLRHPDHIREIYSREPLSTVKFPAILPRVQWIMGQGSFIHAGGEDWKRRRRMVQPSFTRAPSVACADLIPGIVDRWLQRWEAYADSGLPVDFDREFGGVVLDVTFQLFFGTEPGERVWELHDWTHFLLQTFSDRDPVWWPSPRNFRFKRVARSLQAYFHEVVKRRSANPQNAHDVLAMLLQAVDKDLGRKWSQQEIVDEMFSIHFGASIMRVGLDWIFYLLSRHTAALRNLVQEVDSVLQGRRPTAEDLERLNQPLMVFEEATRLYPPVWGTPRYAKEPVEFDGYHFPAKSLLLAVGYFAHRHPDFWENPEGFDPERFHPDKSARRHPYAHYPFGGGPRMCLGRNVAPLICQLILIQVVQKYELRFAPLAPEDPVPTFAFELGMKNPLRMTVHRRTPHKT